MARGHYLIRGGAVITVDPALGTLPRGDVLTKEYVDQWLHLIKENGEYQRIVSRWLK